MRGIGAGALVCVLAAVLAIEAHAQQAPDTGAETEAETVTEPETVTEAAAAAATDPATGSTTVTNTTTATPTDSVTDSVSAPADATESATDATDALGFGDAGELSHSTGLPPGELSASGFVRTRDALAVERLDTRPLAQARQSLDLGLRYKKPLAQGADPPLLRLVGDLRLEQDLAYLVERDEIDDATLDVYESQIVGGESFVALSVGAFDFTLGRQIVAWGQGEMLSPLDVVNPRDLREPGLAELDDIRMAVLASRAGVFVDDHRFEVMLVHESFFGLVPPPFAEFSPLRARILSDPLVGPLLAGRSARFEHVPDRWDAGAGQLFGRWSWTGPGIDLALYGASLLDRQGVAALPAPADLAADPIVVRLYHPRYAMLGHAGAWPSGDFVVRWELGVEIDRPLVATDSRAPAFNLLAVRDEELVGMLGLTWSGIEDGSIGLEVAERWLPGDLSFDPATPGIGLLAPVEEPAFALRWMQNLLRERLRITVVGTAFGLGEFLGWFARAEAGYEIVDALELGLGYATYQPHGNALGPLLGFDEHDRVFTWVRWDFLLE